MPFGKTEHGRACDVVFEGGKGYRHLETCKADHTEAGIKMILKIAAKHEVQYWLDEPGTDAEKLARIVRICRDIL